MVSGVLWQHHKASLHHFVLRCIIDQSPVIKTSTLETGQCVARDPSVSTLLGCKGTAYDFVGCFLIEQCMIMRDERSVSEMLFSQGSV